METNQQIDYREKSRPHNRRFGPMAGDVVKSSAEILSGIGAGDVRIHRTVYK
jgi:hypothetical protein